MLKVGSRSVGCSNKKQRCFLKIQWLTILVINSFIDMPGIVLDTGYTAVNKTKNLCLHGPYSLPGDNRQLTNKQIHI